jgi:DNA invertase Pin-like site-specific DNA recombinase
MSPRRSTPTTPKRAVGYVRISKDREGETSTATQEERIRAHCDAQGWELVDVIVEPGRSAYKASRSARPGMRKVMRLVEAGAADVVAVWKLDRAARNTADLLEFVTDLADHGAAFVSVTESFDTTKAVGKMLLTILSALAEMESATKSERITAWQEHRAATGATPTGPRPYGYRRERNRLIVDEDEAAQVKDAAAAVLAGESLRSIASRMTRTDGEPFTRRGLVAILTGPTIAGLRRTGETFLPARDWKPILDRATWDEVRAVLLEPGRRTGPGPARRWLLSGIAECGRCGTPMQAKPHAAGPRYSCPACHLSIAVEPTDAIVEAGLLALLNPKTWRRLRRRGQHSDTATFEAELLDLAQAHADGEVTTEEWRIMRAGIVQRLEDAAAEPAPLPSVDDVRAAWPDLPIDARRLVVAAATERLAIAPAASGLARFDPSRIEHDLIAE